MKFASNFTWTRHLLFFGNYPSLNAQRRCDNSSTPFHHAQLPGGAAINSLLFSEIMSAILLLTTHSLSKQETLDFTLIIDLRSSVIHGGSRDDIDTVLTGIHLSIWPWVFSSNKQTACWTSGERAYYPSFPLQAQCKVWLYNSLYNPVSGLYSGWVLTLYQQGE